MGVLRRIVRVLSGFRGALGVCSEGATNSLCPRFSRYENMNKLID